MADVFAEPTWAIVELFGHKVIAGQVSSVAVAGTEMLRVDVPGTDESEPFTKFYGGSAIYGITPTDEITATLAVAKFESRPIDKWTLPDRLLPAEIRGDEDRWDEDG